MDIYEATKVVMSRIQGLDPDNASKIIGYILIQDDGEKEMIRLAFEPEALFISHINQAKACLGLPSNYRSSNPSTPLSNPIKPNSPFPQTSPRILIPSHPSSPASGFSRNSPRPLSYAAVVNGSNSSSAGSSSLPFYGGNDFADEFLNGGDWGRHNHVQDQLSVLDDPMVDLRMSPSGRSDSLVFPYHEDVNGIPFSHPHPFHRRSYSVNDAALPCMYYARGFCKNGSNCKFLHSAIGGEAIEVGSPRNFDSDFDEFLKLNAIQQRRLSVVPPGGPRSLSFNKCSNFLSENQRSAAAALMMGEEFQKFGQCRPETYDFSATGSWASANSVSRQIYLTFPADCTFKEEDVSNYFSTYGPVQDVRIPYQQKRMFGFVTFVYPDTVKIILEKGNPHFVCDSRVLVKPYKEKGKVTDKKQLQHQQQHMEIGEYSACLSPSGPDSRDQFDIPFGPRMFCNRQELLLRRKLKQEAELQQAIELQGRRMLNLQLMDLKYQQHNNHSPPSLSAAVGIYSPRQSPSQTNENLFLPSNVIDQEVSEEITHHLKETKSSAVEVDDEKVVQKAAESSNNRGNQSCNKEEDTDAEFLDLPFSCLEHILPDGLFTSPTKFAAEHQSGFSMGSSEADGDIPVKTTSPNNFPVLPSTSAHRMDSLKSCYIQMPRFSSGQEAIEM